MALPGIGSIPFGIPADWALQVGAGEVVRHGALLKDAATGRIVAHLQETGLLEQGLSSLLSLPLGPVGVLTDVVGTFQMVRIDRKLDVLTGMVEGLQVMQAAGLVLGAVGIGVSIAGFRNVNRRLDAVNARLDAQAAVLDRIAGMVEDLHTGMVCKDVERLIAALQRLDDAAERERHREPMLLDVERDVSELVLSFPRHVETALGRGAGLADLAFLIDRFALAAAISVQCPMLLGETSSARNTAARRAAEARRLLDDLTPSRLLKNAPSLDERRAFLRGLRELQAIIGSRPELLATLAARSVDPRAFLERVREEREAPLLLIPHTP